MVIGNASRISNSQSEIAVFFGENKTYYSPYSSNPLICQLFGIIITFIAGIKIQGFVAPCLLSRLQMFRDRKFAWDSSGKE